MAVLLGLDPGSHRLGYGVVEAEGNRLRYRAHGTLVATRSHPLHRRLSQLYSALCEILSEHGPESVAIEKVFVAKNVASALTLGHARGMILLAAGQREMGLAEYSPAEIKKAVTGHGRASKEQVATMVCRILRVSRLDDDPDGTDALAVAVCHAAALAMGQRLGQKARG